MRVGYGFDAHKLANDRRLIIGGVEIPFEKGLIGHSDADVLLHAISDALLGAAGFGDIGGMFPDSDEKYKDADSLILLQRVVERIKKAGFTVGNIDSTIVAQAPRLSGYILKMKENIARACETDLTQINVKATTEEKMGYTGSGLGISAHAVALIETAD